MEDGKRLVQIAYQVEDALARLKYCRYVELLKRLAGPLGKLQELNTECRKMRVALEHNWLAGADRCCSQAGRLLNDLSYSISRVQQLTGGPKREAAKLSSVVGGLKQLQEEFGSMEFEKTENTLSVITEPITLEDVPLGPFRIQLEFGVKVGESMLMNKKVPLPTGKNLKIIPGLILINALQNPMNGTRITFLRICVS